MERANKRTCGAQIRAPQYFREENGSYLFDARSFCLDSLGAAREAMEDPAAFSGALRNPPALAILETRMQRALRFSEFRCDPSQVEEVEEELKTLLHYYQVASYMSSNNYSKTQLRFSKDGDSFGAYKKLCVLRDTPNAKVIKKMWMADVPGFEMDSALWLFSCTESRRFAKKLSNLCRGRQIKVKLSVQPVYDLVIPCRTYRIDFWGAQPAWEARVAGAFWDCVGKVVQKKNANANAALHPQDERAPHATARPSRRPGRTSRKSEQSTNGTQRDW